jgi:hypothetical protein
MTSKKFEISGRGAGQTRPSTTLHGQTTDRFIEGAEPMTTMTVQIPERLKQALKQEALDRRTTVKALLIEMSEGDLAATPP